MQDSTYRNVIEPLQRAGISADDARALRKISMTLHRWQELECGDGNQWASWCIVRGVRNRTKDAAGAWHTSFEYADDGKPYIERHLHSENHARYEAIADREGGALRRLARIMARYPALKSYVQGDPRGAALYILPPGVTDDNYSRGIAVYK